MPLDLVAQQTIMAGEGLRHGLRLHLPEPRAALNISEQKGWGLG
jgi:hypothetical protein